jgi:NitT/TauT family transport system substrate-binding protein
MGRGAIAAAAFAVAASFSPPSSAQDRALLQLDWIPTGEHAAYFAGVQRGFWRENGIELSLTRGYGSGDTVTKLAAGAAQFGVADLGAVLAARARQNVPVRSISAVYTHSPHSLFVLRSSGITTVPGSGGQAHRDHTGQQPPALLPGSRTPRRHQSRTHQLDEHRRLGDGGAADRPARGRRALLLHPPPLPEQGGAQGRRGDRGAALRGDGLRHLRRVPGHHRRHAAAEPGLVRRFLRGAQRSFEWSNANQAEACRLHVQRNPEVEQDDCEGSLRATMGFVFNDHQRHTGLGRFDAERLAFTWRAVAESLQLPAEWDPIQAIDTSLLP